MSDDNPYTVPYIIIFYLCSRDADPSILCLVSLRAWSTSYVMTSDEFFIIIYIVSRNAPFKSTNWGYVMIIRTKLIPYIR